MSEDRSVAPLTERRAWKALTAHHRTIRDLHLRKLFADDPTRGERMTAEAAGLYLDYSKNRVTGDTLTLLLQLAEESCLRERIDALFRGEKINVTENRAVLHMALRAPRGVSIVVDGKNVVPEVHAVLDKMTDFADRIRNGTWKGYTDKRIRNIVNIGIGGSDLGPVMAYEAFKHYSNRSLTFRFLSNIDGTDFAEAVRDLDPAETRWMVNLVTASEDPGVLKPLAERLRGRFPRNRCGRKQRHRAKGRHRRGRIRTAPGRGALPARPHRPV